MTFADSSLAGAPHYRASDSGVQSRPSAAPRDQSPGQSTLHSGVLNGPQREERGNLARTVRIIRLGGQFPGRPTLHSHIEDVIALSVAKRMQDVAKIH